MYLHIGSETIVSEQDMIGIFDLDNTSWPARTRARRGSARSTASAAGSCAAISKSWAMSVALPSMTTTISSG